MAQGKFERQIVQDPNAQRGGNAPSQRLAVQGIMRPSGAPTGTQDRSLTEAVSKLGQLGETMARKKDNQDFLEGQMAAMSGKTQDEIAATGNRTSMAGFVSVSVSNAVAEWSRGQMEAAATQHYGTDPATFQKGLAKSSADLIAQMGGDQYAEEILAKTMAGEMSKIASAQAAQHSQYTQTETANAYTNSLIMSGQYAAQQYDGAAVEAGGPVIGAVSGANNDYRAAVSGFVDQIIQVESGGNARAKNPKSSAAGLGQFIDSTWLSMIKKYRPDLAGKSKAELLELKFNPALSKQMTEAYGAENAAGLASSGLNVTPGSIYLAHFAGLGGARRVLKGNPAASVDTTLTPGQIKANKSIMYKNGRLITNAELHAWAERKMGGKGTTAAPNVKGAILANPGLPPEVHRQSVVSAVITTLSAGDGSLFQNAGGLEGLRELNLSGAQMMQVQRAHEGFVNKRQGAYNMQYEREKHDLLEQAASGNYTEDQMFEMLGDLQSKYGRSDAENLRTHGLIQKELDNAGQAEAAGVWATPDMQYDLFSIKGAVLDGEMTAEEAMAEIIDLGEKNGADSVTTEKQVAIILGAAERVQAAERSEVAKAAQAGQKAAVERQQAEDLISRNILGTGSKKQQEVGIAVLEETLMADLKQMDIPPEQVVSKANDMMAKVLVQNDVVDPRRASMMRAAMRNPIGADGQPTDEAVQAMAFYMDLKHGAGASPDYLTRMFKGNEDTLTMLMNAEGHIVGDANLQGAIATAWEQMKDPVTVARIAEQQKRIDSGELQKLVKEKLIETSGLANTSWNNFMNTFNSDWSTEHLNEEGRERILQDSGINLIVEEETRSAVALYPHATPDTISQIVTGQMAERGAVMGSSFVIAPKDKDIHTLMGLNSKEATAPNSAITTFVRDNGADLFGPAVWEDIGPGFFGPVRPEFTVQLIGSNLVITPASDKYAPESGLFGDNQSIPEAAMAVVPAAAVGRWYNDYQLGSGGAVTNSVVDMLRPTQPQPERIISPHFDMN